jgi:uncharacterized protein
MQDVVQIAAEIPLARGDVQPARTIEDVLHQLGQASDKLPRDAMQWALDNWDVAGPRFVALLDAYQTGADRSTQTAGALFFGLHLLGEKRETAAFPGLCRLMHDQAGIEAVLDFGITETLTRIIISTFDGDVTTLKSVIESDAVDEFVRDAALMAMAYLARTGSMPDEDMRAYMLHLLAEMQPQAEHYIWATWAITMAALGYADLVEEVKGLFARGFVPRHVMTSEDFTRDMRRTLDDPDQMAGFTHDRVRPFEDAIGELSHWYAFSEKKEEDRERWAMFGEPHRNPLRHVGRNDPCPCGSGKKYKKCCLQ